MRPRGKNSLNLFSLLKIKISHSLSKWMAAFSQYWLPLCKRKWLSHKYQNVETGRGRIAERNGSEAEQMESAVCWPPRATVCCPKMQAEATDTNGDVHLHTTPAQMESTCTTPMPWYNGAMVELSKRNRCCFFQPLMMWVQNFTFWMLQHAVNSKSKTDTTGKPYSMQRHWQTFPCTFGRPHSHSP